MKGFRAAEHLSESLAIPVTSPFSLEIIEDRLAAFERQLKSTFSGL